MKSAVIVDNEGNKVGIELVVDQIEAIAKSFKKIESTRSTRRLLVALLHDDTKLGKSQIELVLDSLDGLERRYLKPKKAAK